MENEKILGGNRRCIGGQTYSLTSISAASSEKGKVPTLAKTRVSITVAQIGGLPGELDKVK